MNGLEHYREAERLVATIEHPDADLMTHADHQTAIAAAQVHATLALVALGVNTEQDTLWAKTVTS